MYVGGSSNFIHCLPCTGFRDESLWWSVTYSISCHGHAIGTGVAIVIADILDSTCTLMAMFWPSESLREIHFHKHNLWTNRMTTNVLFVNQCIACDWNKYRSIYCPTYPITYIGHLSCFFKPDIDGKLWSCIMYEYMFLWWIIHAYIIYIFTFTDNKSKSIVNMMYSHCDNKTKH